MPERRADTFVVARLAFAVPPPWTELQANRTYGRHWTVTARHRAKYRDDVRIAALAATVEAGARPCLPLASARCRLTWVTPTRQRHDLDNIIAACKPLFDGLVDAGVLADDGPEHVVELTICRQARPGARPEVLVELTLITNDNKQTNNGGT